MEAVSSAGPSLTAVVGGASVGGGASMIPCYALPCGASRGIVQSLVRWWPCQDGAGYGARGGSPWPCGPSWLHGLCGLRWRPAGYRAARIEIPKRGRGCAGAWATCGTRGRMGFYLAVHAGVHEYLAAVHRAPAGHAGLEGELARRDRAGTGQPGAGRWRRRPGGDGRQPGLRQAERPHCGPRGHAAAMDGHRPGGRLRWHPHRRAGAQHPGRPRRMVHRPAVLQRAARRHGRGAAGPGPVRPARRGLRCPGCLPAHRVGVRHVPGQALHRQPARHVPGPVRDRRGFSFSFSRSP